MKKKLYMNVIDTVSISAVSTQKTKKTVDVVLIDSASLFDEFCMSFQSEAKIIHETMNNKHSFLSLDFEFNINRQHALMQLYFENLKTRCIVIIDPSIVSSKFSECILENHHIIKLLHGSESLDIPYIAKTFCKKKEQFVKFINKTYDTRFACEYVKTYRNYINKKEGDMKCSLYIALLEFKVIDKKQYDYLIDLCGSMKHYSIINWDITKLNAQQIKYAYFDVLYLRHLYKNIIDESKKIPAIYTGLKYIPGLYRLWCLNKLEHDTSIQKMKNTYDSMDSNVIKETGKTMFTLLDEELKTTVNGIQPYSFLLIPTFKKMCIVLFKSVLYPKMIAKYGLKMKVSHHDVSVPKITKLLGSILH